MTNPNLDELISLVEKPTIAEISLISKAYKFAEEAHANHKRFSGEPYFNHLYETAKGLAELGMGASTIAAGLLHDSVEDVGVKPEILEKEFGKEIRFLVEGVTKLGTVRYQGADRHIESLRKFFVAMSKDLMVIIIKLVDRLHNIRTLEHVKKEKQRRIAKETLEIFAPLAFRLGIRRLARELSELSFKYVYPEEYTDVRKLLKHKYQKDEKHLEKLHKSVKKALAKEGIIHIKTYYRIKNTYSLYRKLLLKGWDIEKIYDLAALRIIVPSVAECYQVLGTIHGMWRPLPGRIKDYIAFPKPNGYQGIHTTVFTGDGSIMEVQIRTDTMHQEAEFGIASYLQFKERTTPSKEKEGGALSWLERFFRTFKSVGEKDMPSWIDDLARVKTSPSEHSEFLKNLAADFFENRVFIFTPKGDIVDLPMDSSPIDFAYAIHSDIGHHIAGAKVNGKLVSLNTKLKNGDILEIITNKTAKPSVKWLDYTKTALARRHIKSALETTQKIK